MNPAVSEHSHPAPLTLHVPVPSRQVGRPVSFEHLQLSAAGQACRPPVDTPASALRHLPDVMVRTLDDDGRAIGDWNESLSVPQLMSGLHDMLLVRSLDARMLRAHRQGLISFYLQSFGEEAIACGHQRALEPGDMNFPTYRQQGLLVTAGYPIVDMMNQVLSNRRDPLRGRQLPVMYSSRSSGFFSISGNLATQFVHAVGWAMASAISKGGSIASAWIGEGATAEADFHAALVFASTYQAPVVLNVVNNQWAISTPEQVARGAAATFADRGLGFGIPALRVDGNDYVAVHAVSRWAAARARGNNGPTLIEWVTLRRGAHSTSDDPTASRDASADAEFPLGDPIDRLRGHLVSLNAWDDERHAQLVTEVDAHVSEAFEEASSYGSFNAGGVASPSTVFDDVYATTLPHLREQRQRAGF